MAMPQIAWPEPDSISCGTPLSADQLNATASVPGNFAYSHSAGELLAAGTHTLEVTFTPKDSANYATAQASVSITIAKAKPAIAWPTPDPITYGTRLGAAQLSATASVPGKFIYNPGPAPCSRLVSIRPRSPSLRTIQPTTPLPTAVSLTVVKAEP